MQRQTAWFWPIGQVEGGGERRFSGDSSELKCFCSALVMLIECLCQELIPPILTEQLAMLSSFAINRSVIVTCPTFQINRSNICFTAKFNYKVKSFAFSVITILNDFFFILSPQTEWRREERCRISFLKLAAGRFVLDLQNMEELNFPFLYFSVYVFIVSV